MGKLSRPRKGSLQYYPRKRAAKLLPSLNWKGRSEDNSQNNPMLGFIGYKVGMTSVFAKDNTPNSMTQSKRIVVPATIIECPPVKILSVRFYKHGKVVSEVLNSNLDSELKRKIKMPKNSNKTLDSVKDYDDVRLMVYSQVSKTNIKKTPDITEVALGGNLEAKFNFAKENFNKEIKVGDIFKSMQLVDIRGVTKGKGLQGPVKRFGVTFRQHKAEKGVRKVGSIGPWHPARVTFRVPMAGQTGLFTRAVYNNKVLAINNINSNDINPPSGFKHFGKIKTDYLILRGSVQGATKRQLILTPPLRPTKKQSKLNFEFIELR